MPMNAPYLLFCSREPHNELVAAEVLQLTGSAVDAFGVAYCSDLVHVPRSAYIQASVKILAQATEFDDLVREIQAKKIVAQAFKIEYMQRASHHLMTTNEAIVPVANSLLGVPNLRDYAEQYVLAELENGWVFGRLEAGPDRLYEAHAGKPYHTSSSLPSRIARALVNLAAQPQGLLLNPFCGTGSLLLEACAVGFAVQGADKNTSMVGMSRKNLAHFGYSCSVEQLDVRQWSAQGDALVADLPYDKNSKVSDEELLEILAWGAQASPIAVYTAGRDLTTELLATGYAHVEVFKVLKRSGYIRYVHRCWRAL